MNNQGQLSSALRITNVNDFLAPTTSCVLPGGGVAAPAGSVLAPIVPTEKPLTDRKTVATVTVSDCLSCTGCVTSAETILLSTENVTQLRNFIEFRKQGHSSDHYAVATLSQQSVASIAVQYGMDMTKAARKVTTFLTQWAGFDAVVDPAFARHIALLESCREFVYRYQEGERPIIASACPGWLTYAEKTQNESVLSCLSRVRSFQGILAAVAHRLRPPEDERPIWLLSVAQCHDRKLEAVRPEMARSGSNQSQLNCVITTAELIDLIRESKYDIISAKETLLTTVGSTPLDVGFGSAVASPSDGYADAVMRAAANDILNLPPDQALPKFEKVSKSGDVRVATLSNIDGSIQMRFATAYGFRSLQSVLRKVRAGSCPYDYVELMACPGGCTNGGGQIPPPQPSSDTDPHSAKILSADHLRAVNQAFTQAPPITSFFSDPLVYSIYDCELGGHVGSDEARQKTSLDIQSRKVSETTSIDW